MNRKWIFYKAKVGRKSVKNKYTTHVICIREKEIVLMCTTHTMAHKGCVFRELIIKNAF